MAVCSEMDAVEPVLPTRKTASIVEQSFMLFGVVGLVGGLAAVACAQVKRRLM